MGRFSRAPRTAHAGALALSLAIAAAPLAAQKPPAAQPPVVVRAAEKIGFTQCMPALKAIATQATQGANAQDLLMDWNHEAPESAPLFSLTALNMGTRRVALGINIVPNAQGTCSLLVERISSSQESCEKVAARDLPNYPHGTLVDGIRAYQNPRIASETYMLLNNAGGCVVIRRQAVIK
jgi:hypothetical protein